MEDFSSLEQYSATLYYLHLLVPRRGHMMHVSSIGMIAMLLMCELRIQSVVRRKVLPERIEAKEGGRARAQEFNNQVTGT